MPTSDPRLRPALKRALPADDRPGPVRVDRMLWEILFRDGKWHRATVRTWRTDRHGRDVVDIEWHAEGSTWEESYVADDAGRAKMREPPG